MAENESIQEILLRVKSDKASFNAAIRDLQMTKGAIGDIQNASKVSTFVNALNAQEQSVRGLRVEAEAATKAVKGLNAAGSEAPSDAPGGANKLRLFGSQLRQLPSTQLGGGLSSDAIANVIRLAGALQEIGQSGKVGEFVSKLATLGPLAAIAAIGVAAAAAAVLLVNESSKELALTVKDLIAGQKEYYTLLQNGSREDLADAIKRKQDELAIARQSRDELLKLQTDAFNDAVTQGSDGAARLALVAARAFNVAGINDQDKAINDLNATIAENGLALGRLTGAYDANATAVADLAAAEESRMSELITNIEAAYAAQVELARFERTASSDQLNERVTSNNERLAALKAESETLKAVAASSEQAKQRLAEINAATVKLEIENNLLNSSIKESITVREAAKKAEAEQNKNRGDSINAWKKYTADVTKLTADEQQAQIELEAKYSDTKIAIAQKAADVAENILSKLNEQRASLALNLGRANADAETQAQQDTLNAQIDFARKDARAARDHANNLLDIRRRGAEDEEGLIAKRDFTGLLRSRKSTNNAIDDANRQYARQRADSLEAYEQESDDRHRQFIYEAQQRQLKYQRDLSDAQTQYIKERNAAEANRRKSLIEAAAAYARDQQLLSQKLQADLQARQEFISSELQTIESGNAAKLALEQQYYVDLQAFLQSQLSSIGNIGTNNFSSAATPSSTSVNYAPTYNITSGTDATQVSKIIDKKTVEYFNALRR